MTAPAAAPISLIVEPHTHSQPRGRLRLVVASIVAAATLAAFVPTSAHAQFGKVLKKVVDKKSADANANTASGPPPVYDQTVIELTPERLTKVTDGLVAMRRALVGSDGVQALVKQRDNVNARLAAINDAHGKDLDAYNDAAAKNDACRDQVIDASRSEHQNQIGARVRSDPSFQQKYMELGREMAEASARGDTAAMHKLQVQLQQSMYPATYAKEDTAAADAKCGKTAPEPAWHAQRDSLTQLDNKLGDEIRAAQDRATTAGTQASGMTSAQFAMARERIEMFVQRARNNDRQAGLSQTEVDALHARESQLQQLTDDIQKASMT